MSNRLNRWWIPGDGIARVVIQADVQRYLGPDALVKPGENEGRPGYWITAYRTLTSEMIADLKLDTQRWEREREQDGRRGSPLVGKSSSRHPDFSVGPQDQLAAYQESQIHRSRQYYGPSEPYEPPRETPSRADYNYTHSNSQPGISPYASQAQGGYQVPANPYTNSSHTQPRTTTVQYPQGYGQPTYSSVQPQYGYPTQPTYQQTSTQGQAPPPPHQAYQQPTQSRTARPGYYIASDNKEYRIPPGGIPGRGGQ